MLPAQYNDLNYRKRQSEITKAAWRNGVYDSLRKNETRKCKNLQCGYTFIAKPNEEKIYCSSRCAAIINNSKRPKKIYYCVTCSRQIPRAEGKYCSVKCQNRRRFNLFITRWKAGNESGSIGINTKGVSAHIKHFLAEKYKGKCSRCEWNQKHPATGKIPLEVNHIDGNSDNNKEENLELICPNCHALTPNFRNLNKGNGREWRLNYIKSRKLI